MGSWIYFDGERHKCSVLSEDAVFGVMAGSDRLLGEVGVVACAAWVSSMTGKVLVPFIEGPVKPVASLLTPGVGGLSPRPIGI